MGYWGTLLLSLVLLVACGKEHRVTGFETYVSAFESASQEIGSRKTVGGLIIDWDETGAVQVAQCETGTAFATPHIRVNQNYWNRSNETTRQIMLFHEMGHCVLDRLHRSDHLASGAPASMMFPNLISPTAYQNNRTYYLQELFQHR